MLRTLRNKLLQQGASLILPHLPYRFFDFGFSGKLIIEPTNVCNLRCPLCPTAQNMKREKGFLSLDKFKAIVDEVSSFTKVINMGFAGEPLLNKDIFKMAKYAEEKGIRTGLSTNTTPLDRYLDEVFDSGISNLIVCLEGASKETHEHYRVGSNFEEVRENIRRLCQKKRKEKFQKPHITLQFVVMKHNEHEIDEIVELAGNLGVDSLMLKTLSLGSWVGLERKKQLAKEWLPSQEELSRFRIKDDVPQLKARPKVCGWLRQSVILWNGDVTMCCYDFNGELVVGNIFKEKFQKIWKSERYKRMRKAVVKMEPKLCQNCTIPMDYYGRTITFS